MNGRSDHDRILLVDDDPAMRELLALRLGKLGHEVFEAGSVPEAVALLETAHLTGVLSDNGLPGGSGIPLLAYVKNRDPELRFVLTSGVVTPDVEAAAWAGGATAVVPRGDLVA